MLCSPHVHTRQKETSYSTSPAHLPSWLEATSEASRDIYARWGFEVIGELVMGRGEVDEKGNPRKGGSGVTMYGMKLAPRP